MAKWSSTVSVPYEGLTFVFNKPTQKRLEELDTSDNKACSRFAMNLLQLLEGEAYLDDKRLETKDFKDLNIPSDITLGLVVAFFKAITPGGDDSKNGGGS